MNTKRRYIIRKSNEILHSVEYFCDYYAEIKKYIENKKIVSSVDRGAFALPQFYLNAELYSFLGKKRNSKSYAYGPEIGDKTIRTLIAEIENIKYGTKYVPANIALVAGAWSGVELVIEELCQLKRGKANKFTIVVIGPTHYQMFHRAINMLGVNVTAFDFIASPESGTVPKKYQELKDIFLHKPNAIFITNPNNPHGEFFDHEILKKLIFEAERKGVYVIIDEIQDFLRVKNTGLKYGPWIYKKNVIRIDSFSKKRAIAEYRVGWVIASKEILGDRTSGVIGRLSGMMGNAPRAANTLVHKLLEIEKKDLLSSKNYFEKIDEALLKREKYIVNRINKIPQITILKREACINITIKVDIGLSDFELSQELMEKGVLMMPCSGYGYHPTDCIMRITFAERWNKIRIAIKALEDVCKENKK